MAQNLDDIRRGYDLAAEHYARRMLNELDEKPFDRGWLADFAARLRGRSHTSIDIGCGTGQTTAFLATHGLTITGIDLSHGMIASARTSFPHVEFEVGDMFRLDRADATCDAVVGFYAIVNNPPDHMTRLFPELARVLRSGGQLLLAFHHGQGIVIQDDFLESGARLEFHYHDMNDVVSQLQGAGFRVEESSIREPYAAEFPSQRGYVLAQRLGGAEASSSP